MEDSCGECKKVQDIFMMVPCCDPGCDCDWVCRECSKTMKETGSIACEVTLCLSSYKRLEFIGTKHGVDFWCLKNKSHLTVYES